MDKPSTLRQVNQPKPVRTINASQEDFSLRVNRMLHDLSDVSSEEDDGIDDSDADPDYVLPEENPHEDEYSSDESDDRGRRHTVHDTLDEIMLAAHDDEVGDVDLLQADDLPQGEVQNAVLPEYIFSRLRKNEFWPPYGWTTKEQTVNARVPARNVIRGGLPGLKAPARALGNSPKRINVWNLFDDNMVESTGCP